MVAEKIFVDVDCDVRLSRKAIRDLDVYKRDLDSVLSEYIRFSKPCYEEYVLPVREQKMQICDYKTIL